MSRVAIVTDSTCDLGPAALESLGVRMVPLKVLFGEESFLDWVELSPEEFYQRLTTSPVLPKTSQPSPAEFLDTYRDLADKGFDEIVSVHLSGALSGTVESATMASGDSPIPVHVVDALNISHGLGIVVRAAVEARDAGGDGDAVSSSTRDVAGRTRLLFVLDTLEYLVKGGRAGRAQGLAAALLDIKPVLTVSPEGIIEPFKKVKGRKRALAEVAAAVSDHAREHGRLRIAILHGCLADEGAELLSEIEATGADVELVSRGTVGAVIGTYAGPRAVGVAFCPIK